MALSVMTLTEAAAQRVMALSNGREGGLKVGVTKGGCAGMEYTMEWADSPAKFDEVVEDKGVRLFVDSKAVIFLLGAVMDYRADKLSAKFVFDNPNQSGACGCGESVMLSPASPEAMPSHA
jgi:iron-sulfur cluster assembly protein